MKTNRMKRIISIMAILTILVVSIAVIASATGEITWKGEELNAEYTFYSEFTAPSKYCSVNGTDYVSYATVTFPSGKKSTFSKVLLDEVGEYKVTYFADAENTIVQSEPFTFNVKATPKDMWNTNVMIDSKNSADVADFNEKGAVLLSANERAEARYVNPVYIGDNGANDDLMTFVVVPTNVGQPDFESFYVVVEDYENADNRLYIRFSRGYSQAMKERYQTNVTVSTDGKTFLGKNGKQYDYERNSEAESYILYGSGFYGETQEGDPIVPIKVNLDVHRKTVTVTSTNSLTFDLTDPHYVGEGKEWKGVDSGVAYVYAGFMERLTSASANAAIYTVDGVSMGGEEFADYKAPAIVIDADQYEGAIVAKKGVKHTFLKANAFDMVLGELETSIAVYKINGDVKESVPYSYDGFVPSESGAYYVEYRSEENVAGKVGISGYNLTVLNPEESIIDFDFGGIVDSVKAGEKIVIPEYTVSGGIGKKSVTFSAKVGENVIAVSDGEIIPDYVGQLVLTATCKDVIQTATFTHNIVVNENSEVYFDLGYVPNAIIVGDVLDLTNASVYKYTSSGKQAQDMTVTFAGSAVTDGKIAPTSAQIGEKQLVVSAGGQSKTYDIVVKAPASESGMVANYFSTTKGEIVAQSTYVQVVSSEDTTISFDRDIDEEFLSVQFVALPDVAKFTHLTVNLYDTLDANNYVTFDILNSSDATLGEYSELVYAGETYKIYGNFRDLYGSVKFLLKYDRYSNSIIDHLGATVATLSKRADGKAFNGFRGDVRLTIDVCGVSAETKLNIYKLGDQEFRKNTTDSKYNNGPQISYVESFAPGITNTEYKLPAFRTYDVLNRTSSVSLSVKDPANAEIYTATDASKFRFTPSVSGVHTIILTATDDKGNKTEVSTKINVSLAGAMDFIVGGVNVPTGETVAPGIVINNKPAEKAKVGEAFNIAKITPSDDKTALSALKIYAYVVTPDSERTLLMCTPVKLSAGDTLSEEQKLALLTDSSADYISYKPTRTGQYLIYYVVRDADGLTTIAHYNVEVVNNG